MQVSFSGFLAGALGLLFVYLKLTEQIDWSWFYVTMPFWLGAAVVFSFMALFVLVALFAHTGGRR